MSEPVDVFESIIFQASEELGDIEIAIGNLQKEIDSYKEDERRLKRIIAAASKESSNGTKPKPKKQRTMRDSTREKVTTAIRTVTQDGALDFTIPAIAENMHANGHNPSSVNSAVNILREEGSVRLIGRDGMAPVYRWVGDR